MGDTATRRRAQRARRTQDTDDATVPADRAALTADSHPPGSDPGASGVAGVAAGPAELIADLSVEQIAPEPGFNPRQRMDEQELSELAASIALHGLLQPVLVRPAPEQPGHYLLTGGHRRFEAARRAGLRTVPAIVRRDGDALVAAVLDNSHRVDLNPLEEATAYARAMREKGLTARGVAGPPRRRLGAGRRRDAARRPRRR